MHTIQISDTAGVALTQEEYNELLSYKEKNLTHIARFQSCLFIMKNRYENSLNKYIDSNFVSITVEHSFNFGSTTYVINAKNKEAKKWVTENFPYLSAKRIEDKQGITLLVGDERFIKSDADYYTLSTYKNRIIRANNILLRCLQSLTENCSFWNLLKIWLKLEK